MLHQECVVFTTEKESSFIEGIGKIMINTKISPLKKVSLAVVVTSRQDDLESGKEHLFSFIYGAASDGLCPFERQLVERRPGETFQLDLGSMDIHDFFGHLLVPLQRRLELHILPQQLQLRIAVDKVEKAEDYEIVKAMKHYLGSGCGGSCDCGCH